MPVRRGAVERVIGGHDAGGLCYVDVRMGELCIERCLLRSIGACANQNHLLAIKAEEYWRGCKRR